MDNPVDTRTMTERWANRWVKWHTWVVLFFLIAPILVVLPLSFNASDFFSYPMSGFSLKWYMQVFTSNAWRSAIANSLLIGIGATLIATFLGTLAAMGLCRSNFPMRGIIMPLLISPLIIPVVVVGAGLYFVFSPIGLINTHLGVILAHAALGTPFVVITVTAALLSFDHNLTRAAASLGAGPWTAFRRVTLPLITPSVATGAVFAFATSFDEVIVILFIGGPDQVTVPRQMWSGLRDQINPSILAVATLLVLFAIALFASVNWLKERASRDDG